MELWWSQTLTCSAALDQFLHEWQSDDNFRAIANGHILVEAGANDENGGSDNVVNHLQQCNVAIHDHHPPITLCQWNGDDLDVAGENDGDESDKV